MRRRRSRWRRTRTTRRRRKDLRGKLCLIWYIRYKWSRRQISIYNFSLQKQGRKKYQMRSSLILSAPVVHKIRVGHAEKLSVRESVMWERQLIHQHLFKHLFLNLSEQLHVASWRLVISNGTDLISQRRTHIKRNTKNIYIYILLYGLSPIHCCINTSLEH